MDMFSNLRHFWDLLLGMTEKELKARYKHTFFGFLWVLVNPLLQMIVIGTVFTFFMKEPIEHYYFFLFTGLLVWNFFSLSLSKATPSIVYERSLIKKARFPYSVIPLSIILSNLVHLFIAFILLVIPLLFIGTLTISRLPQFILGFILLIVFTIGLSLLTSALNVRFRDINFFVQAALIIWFYTTPIIYSISVVPKDIMWIWRLNPMTAIIQLFQYSLVGTSGPGIAMLTSNIFLIIVVSILGVLIFRKENPFFDDWV